MIDKIDYTKNIEVDTKSVQRDFVDTTAVTTPASVKPVVPNTLDKPVVKVNNQILEDSPYLDDDSSFDF